MKAFFKKLISSLSWGNKNNNTMDAKQHRDTLYHMRHGRAPVHTHPADMENQHD
ncbi:MULTISPECIES: hypothetical protein [Providencia]|uniref:Uncharacterized protein n=2 Tax=Providencia TaxID=586 RepID=A0AAD2VSE6_PRORE|nr:MULTISPECIES: hypothetical protein [Providencia]EKH6496511.1 hypothetical protein [Providencia rettgeri]ELR5042740.1 hypothetical protein [Providencia rettgeri]ELR5155554.1 hypothetical protein [Providencia rettgeri]ELR5211127.1 hypothetical protein [Providencia rettgeri]ELR5218770.1 hypothetical protein [Providencia rettgeri]